MKIELKSISFHFAITGIEYEARYEPTESEGKYLVSVFIKGIYIVTFNSYQGANKSHAKEFVKAAIEYQNNGNLNDIQKNIG